MLSGRLAPDPLAATSSMMAANFSIVSRPGQKIKGRSHVSKRDRCLSDRQPRTDRCSHGARTQTDDAVASEGGRIASRMGKRSVRASAPVSGRPAPSSHVTRLATI